MYDTVLEDVPRTICTDVSREEGKDVTETKCESALKVVQETVIEKDARMKLARNVDLNSRLKWK